MGSRRVAAYVGDLKTVRDLRCAKAFVRMATSALAWGLGLGAEAVYGIVMDGTPRSPSSYSGRFGIPSFQAVSALRVLRFPVDRKDSEERDKSDGASLDEVDQVYVALSAREPAFAPLGGAPTLRSAMAPVGILTPDRSACGVLEDTRLAKRLMESDHTEMRSAHLSRFAYANVEAGAAVIRAALFRTAKSGGESALFVSVPVGDTALWERLRADHPALVEAPATVFGAGFPANRYWNVSTSEI